MTKHKEALEALGRMRPTNNVVQSYMDDWHIVKDYLQAASWQPIEEWDDDKTFGNYVLVAWENGLVEEMHWAAVREYKKPKHHAGLSLKYFMRMPAAPVDGGR